MAGENEEFEFRLRAEKEAGKKPVAPAAEKPAPASMPAAAEIAALPFHAPAEALASMATGAIAKPVSDVAGLASIPLHAAGAIKISPTEVKEKVQSAAYQPKTMGGKVLAEYNPIALAGKALGWVGGKAKEAIAPPEKEGGAVAEGQRALGRGVDEAIQNIPVLGIGSFPKAGVKTPKATAAPKDAGVGAEKAVNELQRQRNVASGADKPADLAGQSAHEAAVLERDKVTTPLRQKAFNSGERVDAAPVSKMIDDLERKNPDPAVRSALDKVREVIKNATQSSQGSALPAAGSKVSVDQLKAMQGQSSKMPVAMADEVRQSIKRMIDGKDGSGKPMDKHTQEILGSLRDKLVDGAPENYKKYLDEYTRLSKPLDEFKAPGSARDKVTADPAAFNRLNAADKQNMIQEAFNDKTPGRSLSELVRDTAHHPEAAKGVREAYTDWLTKMDDTVGMQPSIGGMTKRWEQTRDAVKSSKLMDESHVAAMDKIMNDLRDAGQKHGVRKAAASVAGWLGGSTVGHPFVAAHAARELLGTGKEATGKATNNAVAQIAQMSADPAGAAALAAPPTPANIAKIKAMMPADVAAALVPSAGRDQPQRKRRDPFSMQPAGI